MFFALQDRTNNLFKQVYEQKSLKGRANDAIASACLYIACRQEGVPRTFKGQNKLLQFQLPRNSSYSCSRGIINGIKLEQTYMYANRSPKCFTDEQFSHF